MSLAYDLQQPPTRTELKVSVSYTFLAMLAKVGAHGVYRATLADDVGRKDA